MLVFHLWVYFQPCDAVNQSTSALNVSVESQATWPHIKPTPAGLWGKRGSRCSCSAFPIQNRWIWSRALWTQQGADIYISPQRMYLPARTTAAHPLSIRQSPLEHQWDDNLFLWSQCWIQAFSSWLVCWDYWPGDEFNCCTIVSIIPQH